MAAFMPIFSRKRKVYNIRADIDETTCKQLYRFEKKNLEWVAEHFLGDSSETRGGALNSLQRMCIFLRYVYTI